MSAASGMNAMAHAVETMYAAKASPIALAIAEEAARLLSESLPRVVAAPGDRDARSVALAGSHLAGRGIGSGSDGPASRLCTCSAARLGCRTR